MRMENLVRWIRLLEAERDGSPETDATVDAALAELLENPDEFTGRLLPTGKRVEQVADTTMSVEDAVCAMSAIESQRSSLRDGTTDTLTMVLLSSPGEFWDRYFTMLNPVSPAVIALSLQLGPDATFADAAQILRKGADA